MQWPAQCGGDLFGNLILNVGQTLEIEIALPSETRGPQMCVKHLQRKTPLPLRFLDGAMDYKADTET